ncbi:MAG: ABC transporter permease [Planctomycetia bacterium]
MKLGRLLRLAWKSLWLHRLRSLLTMLGMLFGVGSVVAMLAIGEGASQDAQAQIRRLGSRNLLLASIAPQASSSASERNTMELRYGLLRSSERRIAETVPGIVRLVSRRDIKVEARYGARKFSTVLLGTGPDYASVANLRVELGRFLAPADATERRGVVVLGAVAAQRLFLNADPIDRLVRVGSDAYRVVGVLAQRGEGTGGTAGTGGESDEAIYTPLETMSDRYGRSVVHRTAGGRQREAVELHRITVEARTLEDVPVVAEALRSFLEQAYPKDDVRLTVPLELLRQAEETKRIFTVVLGSMAAISLLVGGIGIMNIMLATVVERTREIGVRRALGARRSHIVSQFLVETLVLAMLGGVAGLAAGNGFAHLAAWFGKVSVVITPTSLVLAFGTCLLVGLVFGLYPARRAADLDPVEALRRE